MLTIILLAILLIGLVLLAVGIVLILLLKAKNKLAGWVIAAVGLVFTIFSSAIFLMLTVTTSVRGGM